MAGSFASASSQYLSVASAPITAYPLSMGLWFYPTTDNEQVIMCLSDTAATNVFHRIVWSGPTTDDAYGQCSEGGSAQSTGLVAATKNAWNHALYVASGETSRVLYVNGTVSTTATASRTWNAKTSVQVGASLLSSGVAFPFDGNLAEPAIWDATLTAAEAASLATGISPLAIRPGNLVFYSPLVRTLTNDIVGGLTLTNNGTVTVAAHPRIYMPRGPKARRFTTAAVGGGGSTYSGWYSGGW